MTEQALCGTSTSGQGDRFFHIGTDEAHMGTPFSYSGVENTIPSTAFAEIEKEFVDAINYLGSMYNATLQEKADEIGRSFRKYT